MLVFHGGFTKEQVEKFENGEFVIYPKVPEQRIYIPAYNTFDYYDRSKTYHSAQEIREAISEDMYQEQYIFLFKYANDAVHFCCADSMNTRYILVFDIAKDILKQYIGCGKYRTPKGAFHRIEYRLPRRFIKPENIVDVLQTYHFDYFEEDYPEYYKHYSIRALENIEAKILIKRKGLVYNDKK